MNKTTSYNLVGTYIKTVPGIYFSGDYFKVVRRVGVDSYVVVFDSGVEITLSSFDIMCGPFEILSQVEGKLRVGI